MKLFFILLCGLVMKFTWSQFAENFSDSSMFPLNWNGQLSDFQINNEKLQLSMTQSGESEIYLSFGNLNPSPQEIRLKLELDFSPSDNNRLNLFIYSDSILPSQGNEMFYLQFGESGSNDAIVLKRFDSGNEVELIRGQNGRLNSAFELQLKLIQNHDSLSVFIWNDTIQNYQLEFLYTDTNLFSINSFGLDCKYTSSNSDAFFFDDIYIGATEVDSIPPQIQNITVLDSNSIGLTFSESVDTTALFMAELNGVSAFVNPISFTHFHLDFNQNFSNQSLGQLTLFNVQDYQSNQTNMDTLISILYGEQAEFLDLVITELMPDPSPKVGLPLCEYVEVYNRSNKIINLADFYLADLSDTVSIDSNFMLFPNEFCLLIDHNCLDSFSFRALPIDLPNLNNQDDRISLLFHQYQVIDSVHYFQNWHEDVKNDGGFALEKIHYDLNCTYENWGSSLDSNGGTPAFSNSILNSKWDFPHQVLDWSLESGNQIRFSFNKKLEDFDVNSSLYLNSFFANQNEVNLEFGPALSSGDLLEVDFFNIEDCFGHVLDTSILITIPFPADESNLLINEILFNPSTGGSDFVELYNPTSNPVTLKNCWLLNGIDSSASQKLISNHQIILEPASFIVLCKDSNWVKNVFKTNKNIDFIQLSSLPSYPDLGGEVVLLSADSTLIDHLQYSEQMHYPMLNNFEDKSLERISYEGSTNEQSNWNTASGNENFGTPGKKNSQSIEMDDALDFILSSDYLTPNNDGIKDQIGLKIVADAKGVYDLNVYNLEGQIQIQLMNSAYLFGEHSVFWNGKNKDGNFCSSGIYILHLSFISSDGKKKNKRKAVYLKL